MTNTARRAAKIKHQEQPDQVQLFNTFTRIVYFFAGLPVWSLDYEVTRC